MWLPGPEPPKTLGRWAKCVIQVKGRNVYSSGFESVGVYPYPFTFDAAWAPDSVHAAYRAINTLRILDRQGRMCPVEIPCTNSLISSFKWTSPQDLLLVIKEQSSPIWLYEFKPTTIRILRLNLDTGFSERYAQALSGPQFISHSIGYEIREISPFSDRVAFSDGPSVCVYDDNAGKVTTRIPIQGSLIGVWWEADDKLLLELRASPLSEQFIEYDLKTGGVRRPHHLTSASRVPRV